MAEILDRIESGRPLRVDNRMTRQLGGAVDLNSAQTMCEQRDRALVDPVADTSALLRRAKQAIDDADFVGFVDAMPGFLGERSRCGINIRSRFKNVRQGHELEFTGSQMRKIRDYNSLDEDLYDYAMKTRGQRKL